VIEVELALGHAHEHLDPDGRLVDPTHDAALRDCIGALLGELQYLPLAA
jgi:hypothetical protein